MRKFRHILCLYLFVAVIMGAVVITCDSDSFAPLIYSENETEITVMENDNIKDIVTDYFEGEENSLSENQNFVNDEAFEDILTEDYTESENEMSEASESETSKDAQDALPEDDFSEENVTEGVSDKVDFKEISYHNSYIPGGKYENVSELYFLSDTVDRLATESSVNVYTFSVTSRSVFSFDFIHNAPQTVEGWKISLYGEYYPDGDEKNKAYRLIGELNTTVFTVDSFPETGLPAGEYRLVVTKGNAYDENQYKITALLEQTSSYEMECNDNIYRYTEIYNGMAIKGSASYFPDSQDDDYYLFRMYTDGFAELKFEHAAVKDKPTVCWQVMICSEDGNCVYSVNSLFAETTNKSGRIGLDKGNYYILVRNRVYTDMTYILTMGRAEDGDYENEKNDTPETADSITFGSSISGIVASQINGFDKDYFTFDVENDGYCEIEFSHEPIVDTDGKNGWNIVLIDKIGNIIYEGISAWEDDVVVSSAIGLDKGTYYIRIDSANLYNNSEKYYLTVNFTEDSLWETESNNSFETADKLFSGTPVYGILVERESDYDYDYFVIDIEETSDVTISFSHEKRSGHKEIFNFIVYDSDENALACYSPTGNGTTRIKSYSDDETVTATYMSLAPGRYYVRVSAGIFFDNIRYSLKY